MAQAFQRRGKKKVKTGNSAIVSGVASGTAKSSPRKASEKKPPADRLPTTSQTSDTGRKKQTACRGGAQGLGSRSQVAKPQPAQPTRRTKQTARRSGGVVGGERPVLTYYRSYDSDDRDRDSRTDYDRRDPAPNADPPTFDSLGLINGFYEIRCRDLAEWDEYPEEEFSLILALSGKSVWGEYDFGMFHGILLSCTCRNGPTGPPTTRFPSPGEAGTAVKGR